MEVEFVDTTFRDGSQSLWAMGMRTGMMEAVAEHMDQAGFKVVEVPVNSIFFKKFVLDLQEDPWEMCHMLGEKMPHVVKACMAGPSLRPFELDESKEMVKLFIKMLADRGALNRAQVMANTSGQVERAISWYAPFLKKMGIQFVLALSYTISPRHTDEYYARKTREILSLQPDAIYLKDQGGLLTPDRVKTLIPAILENAGNTPVELHSHCTTGLAEAVYVEALKLGVKTIHTAIPPLANGSSQPSVFSMAKNARYLGYSHALNEDEIREASKKLQSIAQLEQLPQGAPLEYDYGQYIYQIPGGVISNLRHQLKTLKLEDRLDEVLEETIQVRKDLGYPIMITPYSQYVVTQSVVNVVTGERYKQIIDEIILFAYGVFGEDSGYPWMDQNLKDRCLSLPRAKEVYERYKQSSADVPLKKIREQLGDPYLSDEELVLRYIMKGEKEIKRMRAAGPYKKYLNSSSSLMGLLKELGNQKSANYIHIQTQSGSLLLRRNSC